PAARVRVPGPSARRLPRLRGGMRHGRVAADLPHALGRAGLRGDRRGPRLLRPACGGPRVSRPLVSVIVPVYFNAGSLPRLAERLRAIASAASANFDLEVLFVDDGSGDASWERIEQIAREWPAARGVRLTRNFGSQMAIAAGLREARGDAAAV